MALCRPPGHTAFSSGRVEVLGLGVHRRSQLLLEQEGTQLGSMVSVVFGLPSTLGPHRSGIASPPVMGELPQGVPEDAGGSSSTVGWAVPGGHCSHCPVLQHSTGSSSLLCPPPLSFLPRTFPNCILCLHLAFLSALGEGWLVVASLTVLGRGAGDCQARAVLWPHVLVTSMARTGCSP